MGTVNIMKSFRTIILWGTSLVGLLATGCGGSSTAIEQLPKGEGNIPIGRAQNKEMGESAITIEMSDGHIFQTFTKQQVIYAPTLPKGNTVVTIVPGNRRFNRYILEYSVGADQFWAFNVRPVSKVATQVIKDLEVNLAPGQSFKVGDQFQLVVKVLGADLDGIKPTIYVNGGSARIDGKDTLVFTKPGVSELVLELLGYERAIEFSVEP